MRIAFICGSIEPSFDGVGDYTRQLAQKISESGFECYVIALNDSYVKEVIASKSQHSKTTEDWIRIPSLMSWRSKAKILDSSLKRIDPDWISFQYVPYSFSRKGIPWRLLQCIGPSRSYGKWQVMAHELWVDGEENLKNQLLATVQKLLLKLLLAYIKPHVLHTSNEYYVHQLETIGHKSLVLPLFSNIPSLETLEIKTWKETELRFVLFGSIHREWKPEALVETLMAFSKGLGKSHLVFVSVGNAGEYGKRLWSRLNTSMPEWVKFIQMGTLSHEAISKQLQQADFGVTTTPSHLVGKSGSVAAMLAHDLPVIVPRVEKTSGRWHQTLKSDKRFIPLDSDFPSRVAEVAKDRERRKIMINKYDDQIVATAKQYIVDLEAAE
jgi:hypothetical protein